MSPKGYRKLVVWNRARDLAVEVCRATAAPIFNREWSLRDQLRRSAVSVPSNVAEGNERGSKREMMRFCYYARGSLAELSTQVDIASRLGLLPQGRSDQLQKECDELGGMIMRLIQANSR